MKKIAFWYEFRRRADFILWLAMLNPLLLGMYALSEDISRPIIEFWLIGLGITFLVCWAAFIVMYVVTALSVNESIKIVMREKVWNDAKANAWPLTVPRKPR